MNFLLSGYYGYDNAGDEAVLAAMLDHIGAVVPAASFTVTSGDAARTVANHGDGRSLRAIGRQNPKELVAAIRACDVFLSGGGSLLQDVTSVRNVVYYTSLIRFARLSRKPVMIYAQGVGPLRQRISQKLARASMQSARLITLRDDDSAALLRKIGVTRAIEVTADPVWALQMRNAECGMRNVEVLGESTSQKASDTSATAFRIPHSAFPIWAVGLRSWPGESGVESTARFVAALRVAASQAGAVLRFFPMQHPADFAILDGAAVEESEICGAVWRHPRETMRLIGECDVMIAMRLHALIFAAAGGVPCVAVNYDPKVESLAKLIGAPLVQGSSESDLAGLGQVIAAARPMDTERLKNLQEKARRNAALAVGLA